jgi:hypothetical protein
VISHKIDLWLQDGEACYAADDSFTPADRLEGVTRSYDVSEGGSELFRGSLAQFEDCFGGVRGREDVLFAVCADSGWTLHVVDEVAAQ